MSLSTARIAAIVRKELRDYRRNRFVVSSMAVLPVIFVALPTAVILALPAGVTSDAVNARIGLSLLYLLVVPAIIPASLAAYSVVGEREQGTLEPVLTTPVRREEILLGKALAALMPTLAMAYAIYGIFLALAAAFAQPGVRSAVFAGSHLLVQLAFTPLLAGWSIWVGIAISTRASDVRAAQQLSILASLPLLAVTSLMSFGVIHPTLAITLGLAAAVAAIDGVAWRIVSAMFDRERLVTGIRS
ncbi:MAG TPA: ABC transporter permease subunit [Trebonia sp.]